MIVRGWRSCCPSQFSSHQWVVVLRPTSGCGRVSWPAIEPHRDHINAQLNAE